MTARYCSAPCAADDWPQHSSELEADATEVWPRVWLGGLRALANPAVMQHVTAVVSVVSPTDVSPHAIDVLAGVRDARYDDDGNSAPRYRPRASLYVPMEDTDEAALESGAAAMRRVAAFLDEHRSGDGTMLVHCMAGHSRSAAMLVYYAATRRVGACASGCPTVDGIVAEIRTRRPLVQPNDGFMRVLRETIE
jgi:predicted protein tyrosine phosphatase